MTCTGEPNKVQYPSDIIALVVLSLMAAALGSARQKRKVARLTSSAPQVCAAKPCWEMGALAPPKENLAVGAAGRGERIEDTPGLAGSHVPLARRRPAPRSHNGEVVAVWRAARVCSSCGNH